MNKKLKDASYLKEMKVISIKNWDDKLYKQTVQLLTTILIWIK